MTRFSVLVIISLGLSTVESQRRRGAWKSFNPENFVLENWRPEDGNDIRRNTNFENWNSDHPRRNPASDFENGGHLETDFENEIDGGCNGHFENGRSPKSMEMKDLPNSDPRFSRSWPSRGNSISDWKKKEDSEKSRWTSGNGNGANGGHLEESNDLTPIDYNYPNWKEDSISDVEAGWESQRPKNDEEDSIREEEKDKIKKPNHPRRGDSSQNWAKSESSYSNDSGEREPLWENESPSGADSYGKPWRDTSVLDRLDRNDWYFGDGADLNSNLKIDLRQLWGSDEEGQDGRTPGEASKRRKTRDARNCECVEAHLCDEEDSILSEEIEIDRRGFRQERCQRLTEVCCTNPRSERSAEGNEDLSEPIGERIGCGQIMISRNSPEEMEEDFAKPGEFPWLLKLATPVEDVDCGASLIRSRLALTAAHCINRTQSKDLFVLAGAWNSNEKSIQTRKVIQTVVHPDYSFGEYPRNDVALLLLDRPIEMTDGVNTVCLPVANDRWESSACLVAGRGKGPMSDEEDSNFPEKGTVTFLRQRTCQNALQVTETWRHYFLHDSFFCGFANDGSRPCLGKEGSPIVCPLKTSPDRYVQIGLVTKSTNCDETGMPGVFTNVLKFLDWANEFALERNLLDETDLRNA